MKIVCFHQVFASALSVGVGSINKTWHVRISKRWYTFSWSGRISSAQLFINILKGRVQAAKLYKFPCWHVSGAILGWPEHWVWVIVEESRGSAAFRGVSQKGVQQRKYPVLDCCRAVERSSRRGKDFQTTRWCNLQDLHQWHSSFRGTNINDNLIPFLLSKKLYFVKNEVRGTWLEFCAIRWALTRK